MTVLLIVYLLQRCFDMDVDLDISPTIGSPWIQSIYSIDTGKTWKSVCLSICLARGTSSKLWTMRSCNMSHFLSFISLWCTWLEIYCDVVPLSYSFYDIWYTICHLNSGSTSISRIPIIQSVQTWRCCKLLLLFGLSHLPSVVNEICTSLHKNRFY